MARKLGTSLVSVIFNILKSKATMKMARFDKSGCPVHKSSPYCLFILNCRLEIFDHKVYFFKKKSLASILSWGCGEGQRTIFFLFLLLPSPFPQALAHPQAEILSKGEVTETLRAVETCASEHYATCPHVHSPPPPQ